MHHNHDSSMDADQMERHAIPSSFASDIELIVGRWRVRIFQAGRANAMEVTLNRNGPDFSHLWLNSGQAPPKPSEIIVLLSMFMESERGSLRLRQAAARNDWLVINIIAFAGIAAIRMQSDCCGRRAARRN
ncbi:MAG: hypothetical protein AMXMBFR84_14120 [Candidatus Hydrogenedentota bacterium]